MESVIETVCFGLQFAYPAPVFSSFLRFAFSSVSTVSIMSAKAIREATGKDMLNRLLSSSAGAARCNFAAVDETTNWDQLVASNPWLKTTVSAVYIFY